MVFIYGHGSISLVVPGPGGIGTVDRDLVVVATQAMAVGVCIGEQTTLGEGREERGRCKKGEKDDGHTHTHTTYTDNLQKGNGC